MTNICSWNKYGYCKFGNKCRLRHEDELCLDKDIQSNANTSKISESVRTQHTEDLSQSGKCNLK